MARRGPGKRNNGERSGSNGPTPISQEFQERLAPLIDEWLMFSGLVRGCVDEAGKPIKRDVKRAARLASEIRTMLSPLPGRVFGFGGFAIWCDDATPAGTIRHADVIILS